jgi:Sortase domain
MVLALVGAALLGAGLLSHGQRAFSAANFGVPEATASAAPVPPSAPDRQPASAPAATETAPRGVASSRPPSPTATTPSRRPLTRPAGMPVLLAMPAYGVQADVVPILSSPGSLSVPANPRQVGWWIASALAGSARGSTVVDGHVDSASAGIGALSVVSRLRAGDLITVRTDTAGTIRYRVYARHSYPKDTGLPSTLFTSSGPAHLVLITCGGPFDATARSYLDNIVVFAAPIAA